MLNFLYLLCIAPLEFLMRLVLEWGFSLTHSWGLALLVLSLVVNTAILPIDNWAERRQEEERALRRSMSRHEDMLRKTFHGQKRFALLSTLRRQYGYRYAFTMQASIGLLLQIPFFFAAYHLLSHFEPLNGQPFGLISDLGSPDALLSWGGLSINCLPLVMTGMNMMSAFVYTSGLTRRDRAQIYGMALLFLVLLYTASSALTLYWTFNNIYSLCKNIVEKGWMRCQLWRNFWKQGQYDKVKEPTEGTASHLVCRLFNAVRYSFGIGTVFWVYTSTVAFLHHNNLLDEDLVSAILHLSVQCVLTAFLASFVLFLLVPFRSRRQSVWYPAFLCVSVAVLFLLQFKLFKWGVEIRQDRFLFDMWNSKGWLCFGIWTLGVVCLVRLEDKFSKFVVKSTSMILSWFGFSTAEPVQEKCSLQIFQACLLPSLGLVYGHLFMWGQNAHMFTSDALLGALAIVLVCAIFIVCFNYISYWVINTCLFKFPKIKLLIFSYFISVSFVFLTLVCIKYDFIHKIIPFTFIVINAFVILFCTIFFKKIKISIICLTVMLLISSFNFIKNNFFEEDENIPGQFQELSNIKFKKKPNIYLFWLESYHDFDTLKKIYDIDNSDYRQYIEDKKFIIQEKTYSSERTTLRTFATLFLSRFYNIKEMGKQDLSRELRGVIGGNGKNFVLRVLKNNQYKTIFITGGSRYYFLEQGKYLDETDVVLSSIYEKFLYPIITINNICEQFPEAKKIIEDGGRIKKIIDHFRYVPYQGDWPMSKQKATTGHLYSSTYKHVKIAIEKNSGLNTPYIVIFQGGAEHTPVNGYTWKNRDKWIKSNKYKEWVKSSDIKSKKLISYILSKDPGCIIILLGDHGPWTYRGPFIRNPEKAVKHGISVTDIFDDIFRVLFAYRLPYGAQDDISHGMYMSNINIFMHIFAYLADDPGILKHRTRSVSHLGEYRMVEGKLVEPEQQPETHAK